MIVSAFIPIAELGRKNHRQTATIAATNTQQVGPTSACRVCSPAGLRDLCHEEVVETAATCQAVTLSCRSFYSVSVARRLADE